MTIEATLASINDSLISILRIMQTGAAAPAALAEVLTTTAEVATPSSPAPEQKKSRTRQAQPQPTSTDAGAVLEGDEPGTQYWMSHDLHDFYKTAPGQPKPSVQNINNVSAAYFAAHKAEAAKKQSAAEAAAQTAATEPSATPQADAASTTSQATPADNVTFKEVVEALTKLSKDTRPGLGREGLMAILTKHLSDLPVPDRKVPKLEALKKNGELLAEVNALLADQAAAEVDLF